MRPQVVVLGPIERELYVQLSEDLLPPGTKRAQDLSWRIVGSAVELSERLARLGLSAAIITSIGTTPEDKEVLSSLRQRGIQTRGIRSDARTTPITVRVRTPRHEIRMTSSASDTTPEKKAVLRALPGTRHFHVCGSIITEPRSFDTATSALARARSIGASTSLDVSAVAPTSDWRALRRLLTHVDVLFADSETLRALAELARIGAAATRTLELGPNAIAIRLGAGGSRVYSRDNTNRSIRIPNLGAEVERAGSAVASGYLLGRLLGSRPEICGVLGSVAALATTKPKLPDRRELASRLAEARKNPLFSKLVPALSEGGRLLERTRRLPRRDLAPAKSRLSR